MEFSLAQDGTEVTRVSFDHRFNNLKANSKEIAADRANGKADAMNQCRRCFQHEKGNTASAQSYGNLSVEKERDGRSINL
jgi:hypothetical protein